LENINVARQKRIWTAEKRFSRGCQKGGGKAGLNPLIGFNYPAILDKRMPTLIVLEKSSKHFSRFMELLKANSEVRIKDVQRLVHRSSYYAIIIKKLYDFNRFLRELNPAFYLAEPCFIIYSNRKVYNSIKRCSLVEIESKDNFFVLRFNDDGLKNKIHPGQGKP